MNSIQKQILNNKLYPNKLRLQYFFIILILLGVPLNLYNNRFYDNSWTIGEWLISYKGGFVRRGLPGQIIHFIAENFNPKGPEYGTEKVCKGGSWFSNDIYCTPARRYKLNPDYKDTNFGFRCVKDLN